MTFSTQQFVKSQIEDLLDQIQLQQISFPLFKVTYSLWRKVCYNKLKKQIKPTQFELTLIKKQFFQVSQRQLLPKFINKLKKELNAKQLGLKKAIQQQNQIKNTIIMQQYSQILFNYSQTLFLEQFYIELFKDLVSIPYLNFYSSDATFQVHSRFLNSYYQKKKQKIIDKTFNKMGKTALTKGLNFFSQSIIKKSFFYKMSSLIGSVNPLIMIASLSIGSLVENFDQKNKLTKMIEQIKILTEESKKNVGFLQEHYEKCLSCIQSYLNSQNDKKLQKKIKKQIQKVLEEDWLTVKQQQNGQWQIVTLKQKDSFHAFDRQNSTKINLEELENDFQ